MMAPKVTPPTETPEFARLNRRPLELLRHTEALLRHRTVDTIAPVLPPTIATTLQEVSAVADTSLAELAEIDLDRISDQQLQPARIFIGLSFVGFGALLTALLMLYLCTMHSNLSPAEQMRGYWYPYVWFVCLGITGMFVLGREAMRSRK